MRYSSGAEVVNATALGISVRVTNKRHERVERVERTPSARRNKCKTRWQYESCVLVKFKKFARKIRKMKKELLDEIENYSRRNFNGYNPENL